MNKARYSVSLRRVGGSRAFATDVDATLSPEETLVPDARAGVTPSEMVDRKLLAALGGAAASDHTRPPGRLGQRPGTRLGQTRPGWHTLDLDRAPREDR
jgi:hypothetical protein